MEQIKYISGFLNSISDTFQVYKCSAPGADKVLQDAGDALAAPAACARAVPKAAHEAAAVVPRGNVHGGHGEKPDRAAVPALRAADAERRLARPVFHQRTKRVH